MMAEDIRQVLLDDSSVETVSAHLKDHSDAKKIEAGVNAGKLFNEAFPDEAFGDLGQLRKLFLSKGLIKRQERLIRSLVEAGLPTEEICELQIRHLFPQNQSYFVRMKTVAAVEIHPSEVVPRYLERRAEIGLDRSPNATLITNLSGKPMNTDQLRHHLITARTVRAAMNANASFCCAILKSRREKIEAQSDEASPYSK